MHATREDLVNFVNVTHPSAKQSRINVRVPTRPTNHCVVEEESAHAGNVFAEWSKDKDSMANSVNVTISRVLNMKAICVEVRKK